MEGGMEERGNSSRPKTNGADFCDGLVVACSMGEDIGIGELDHVINYPSIGRVHPSPSIFPRKL